MFAALTTSVAVAILSLGQTDEPPEALRVDSRIAGKAYYSDVFFEDVDRRPGWDSDEDNPPVSARKAIKLAKRMRDAVVKVPRGFRWQLHEASLTPVSDGWAWFINYRAVPAEGDGDDKEPNMLTVVVLMDEAVVPIMDPTQNQN